jgi:hypothetical protein
MALCEQDFVRLVLAEFPSLRPDFEEWNGLLHLQMMEFEIFTEKAAAAGQSETLERCLRLADLFKREGDNSLSNAIHVSFLENLPRQGDVHRTLRQRMSPMLCKAWDDIVAYVSSGSGNANLP